MSRYIDVDSLYRRVKEKTNPYGKPTLDYKSGLNVLRMIENEPTADVVEIVRCKDCKHSYFVKSCSKYECRKGCGTLKYANDYCSYGERKER